jgi:hypothetical protein
MRVVNGTNGTGGMRVAQVKRLVGEWLAAYRGSVTGLIGAHFVASIATLPDDATFASYDDVDFRLVLEAGHPLLASHGPLPDSLETAYQGVILEGGYKPVGDYRSPEGVLANPEIAHHLTADSLLHDPDGLLYRLRSRSGASMPAVGGCSVGSITNAGGSRGGAGCDP